MCFEQTYRHRCSHELRITIPCLAVQQQRPQADWRCIGSLTESSSVERRCPWCIFDSKFGLRGNGEPAPPTPLPVPQMRGMGQTGAVDVGMRSAAVDASSTASQPAPQPPAQRAPSPRFQTAASSLSKPTPKIWHPSDPQPQEQTETRCAFPPQSPSSSSFIQDDPAWDPRLGNTAQESECFMSGGLDAGLRLGISLDGSGSPPQQSMQLKKTVRFADESVTPSREGFFAQREDVNMDG